MLDTIKAYGINLVWFLLLLVIIWGSIKSVSDRMSDYEVIAPEEGVKCIVVSRAFNTSVDCWEIKKAQTSD